MRGLLLDRRRGRGYGFDLGLSRPGGRGRIDEEGRELGSRERPVNVPEPSSGHGWRGCSVHHVAAAHVDTPYQVCLEPPDWHVEDGVAPDLLYLRVPEANQTSLNDRAEQ